MKYRESHRTVASSDGRIGQRQQRATRLAHVRAPGAVWCKLAPEPLLAVENLRFCSAGEVGSGISRKGKGDVKTW